MNTVLKDAKKLESWIDHLILSGSTFVPTQKESVKVNLNNILDTDRTTEDKQYDQNLNSKIKKIKDINSICKLKSI